MRRRALIAGGAALATILVVALTHSSAEAAPAVKAGDHVLVPRSRIDQTASLPPELAALVGQSDLVVRVTLVAGDSIEGVIEGWRNMAGVEMRVPDALAVPVSFGRADMRRIP